MNTLVLAIWSLIAMPSLLAAQLVSPAWPSLLSRSALDKVVRSSVDTSGMAVAPGSFGTSSPQFMAAPSRSPKGGTKEKRPAFITDTPPTVTSTNPANGATGVSLSSTVTVSFNKAVNVTAPAFKLECPTGTPVSFTVSPAPPGGATSFVIHPVGLPASTTCTTTVVANQVADLAGTHLAADFVFSFQTLGE
jgi:hypothetical protein